MTVGYPDYQRLDRAGGYLLYGVNNVTPPFNTRLFAGYVGLWPYITVALSVGNGADTAQIVLSYYTDETFATQVGFRIVNRQSGQFSVTQYANLSEWLIVSYVSKSGNPVPFAEFAVYASVGTANQFQLVSMDVPVFQVNASVGIGATTTAIPQHVQPGPSVLSISTPSAAWFVEIAYYDYGSGTFILLTHIDQTIAAKGGVFAVAVPDTPIQVSIRNSDTVAQFIRVSIVSTL